MFRQNTNKQNHKFFLKTQIFFENTNMTFKKQIIMQKHKFQKIQICVSLQNTNLFFEIQICYKQTQITIDKHKVLK